MYMYVGEFPCVYVASDVFVRKERDWHKLGMYIRVHYKPKVREISS